MGGEIQLGNTAARTVIHYAKDRWSPFACKVEGKAPFTNVWAYVHCPGCEAAAPPGAIPPRPPLETDENP